jgi:OmcA/MtrC family decaheme c-type cytochrome
MDHAAGAPVNVANLTVLTAGMDYTLDEATGTITETPEIGDVAVVVSYTTDFVMPMEYPTPLNDSPDLGEASGEWTGKSLVDGTYSLTVWGNQNLSVTVAGEVTSYRGTSPPEKEDFLVGAAMTLDPYDLITSDANCYACHQDLYFHGGGRRGFDTCLACHGSAGSEDRPQYRAWGAPATTGVQIGFREMLHKIHMGEELTNASAYQVIVFGSGGPPNNYTAHSYDHVVFPALPGGAQTCSMCHGDDGYELPVDRNHPDEQTNPSREWANVCSACHDSNAATAHINTQIFAGLEACSTCHADGREWDVERVHKTY